MLREKNYAKAVSSGVDVIVGEASFIDNNTLLVTNNVGEVYNIFGKSIYINTGASPFIPDTPGLAESRYAYTSEQMLSLEKLPENLVIVGGGYIGLEFASYYRNFGSNVSIIQSGDTFIPKEDSEIANLVLESFEARGIGVLKKTKIVSVSDNNSNAVLSVSDDSGQRNITADAILIATGRRPNIARLNLANTDVKITDRGAIQVDDKLKTTADNIWATGDCVGGMQFTYISLDDSRIVSSQIFGKGDRSTKNRGEIPYSVFIDPPLSRVGLSESQAKEMGYELKIGKLMAAAIPKAHILKKTSGMLKVLIDAKTDKILGAHLFCAESHELINIIKLAMDAGISYEVLKNSVYTHPTMSEALNDLFGSVK